MHKTYVKTLFFPLIIALFSICLTGCASIKFYKKLNQPTDTVLSTHVGGEIFQISISSDLPNAFGGADIWGGKVDRGFLELRFQGVTEDGKIALRLTDIETQSNETTMSRYGVGHSTMSATTTVTPYGTAYTTGTGFYISPPKGSTQYLPPNTTEFLFDPSKESSLTIKNVTVVFLEAKPYSLTYKILK